VGVLDGPQIDHQVFTEYYAPGYGMVRSVIQQTDGSEITLDLVTYDLPSMAAEEE